MVVKKGGASVRIFNEREGYPMRDTMFSLVKEKRGKVFGPNTSPSPNRPNDVKIKIQQNRHLRHRRTHLPLG
jgi:hypothetical protein